LRPTTSDATTVQTAGPAANLVGEVTKERGVGRLVERQLQPAIHAIDVAFEGLRHSEDELPSHPYSVSRRVA
jgi:hypothetical protein